MATTYTVKSGDTLSKIASQYGVPISQISGYKSGDPNLIYPNEVLSIGSTTPQTNTSVFNYKPPSTPFIYPNTTPPATNVSSLSNPTPSAVPPTNPTAPLLGSQVGSSMVDAGQKYIQQRTELGLPSDETTLKSLYYTRGLNSRLGDWRGSAEQYNAMSLYDQTENKLQETEKLLEEAKAKAETLDKARQSGMTINPETTVQDAEAFLNNFAIYGNGNGDTSGGTYTPDIAANLSLGSTDLADIINEFSTTSVNPESEIDKEQNKLDVQAQNAKFASALDTLQQNLAARGLTFSGIRTKAEEGLVAENLRQLTGLSLDLSSKIISAARTEQTKRETAYKQIQDIQNKALEAMGYVINPITGKISPTLQRETATAKTNAAPATIGTADTGYFQWNASTGQWESTGIQGSPNQWSDPYELNGKTVQKNLKTGEIRNIGDSGVTSVTSLKTLEEQYGITRTKAADGGYNFFIKDPNTGQSVPVHPDDIAAMVPGVSYSWLLQGSTNPVDIEKMGKSANALDEILRILEQ